MEYYEAPSFSLGLDLDFDSEPQIPVPDYPNQKPASELSVRANTSSKEGDGGEVGTGFVDCIADSGNDPPRKLKRLKRGPPEGSSLAKQKEAPLLLYVVDDDIEEFSSQEDFPRAGSHPSSHFRSVCSSSKVPLRGIRTASNSSHLKTEKKKQVLDAPTTVDMEKQNKSIFFNLTISPLRKFQLLDSDSDDPSGCDNQTRRRHETISSLNEQKTISSHSASVHEGKQRLTSSITQKEDLWKDFHQTKRFQLPTPAFDEVCREFSQLQKENKVATNLGSNTPVSCKDHHTNNSSCLNEERDKPNCPAHYYFFHDDSRIQNLVRNRLPNFSPLGVDGTRGSVIDYMRQFSNGEASTRQAPLHANMERSSKKSTGTSNKSKNLGSKGRVNMKARKKPTKLSATQKSKIDKSSRNMKDKLGPSNSEELLKDSGNWIDPKSSSSLPRDAGKRRIHASEQSTGHWYTSPEGKKVYVTKSGEELTGRTAYRCYKKDNGGFRKSKKKVSGKQRKR